MLIDSLSLMEIWSFSRARNVWVKPWIECFKFYFIKDFQLTLSSKESSTDISSFCCETCTLNAFKWSWLLPRYDWISGALEWWLTDCGTSELGFWYVSLGTLEIISRVASAIFLKPYIIFLLNPIECHRHSSPTPVLDNICYLHRRSFAFCTALFFPLHSPGQYLNMTWNLFPRSFLSCFQKDISLTSLKTIFHFRIFCYES